MTSRASKPRRIYYLHTINDHPGVYVEGQGVCYASFFGPPNQLASSLAQIRREQKESGMRDQENETVGAFKYGYIRVTTGTCRNALRETAMNSSEDKQREVWEALHEFARGDFGPEGKRQPLTLHRRMRNEVIITKALQALSSCARILPPKPADGYPHRNAAFINAIAEEGNKADAVERLQNTWNELMWTREQFAVPESEAVQGGWISVADRKPGHRQVVLVCGGTAYYKHDSAEWFTISGEDWPGKKIQWEVTHWMPLPNPPSNSPRSDK